MEKRVLFIFLFCAFLLVPIAIDVGVPSEHRSPLDNAGSIESRVDGCEPRPLIEVMAKLINITPDGEAARAVIAVVSCSERDLEEVELSCEPPAGATIEAMPGKWSKKVKLHKKVPKNIELSVDLNHTGVFDFFFKATSVSPADSTLDTEAYVRVLHGVEEQGPEETENTLEWIGELVEEGQP
ncbi:MAG: hypothetical protein AB1756_07685 [Acidobacteriota bacterium]